MNVTVALRQVYGRDTFYPINEAARTFAAIAGTTTLTEGVLARIRSLWLTVDVVPYSGSANVAVRS